MNIIPCVSLSCQIIICLYVEKHVSSSGAIMSTMAYRPISNIHSLEPQSQNTVGQEYLETFSSRSPYYYSRVICAEAYHYQVMFYRLLTRFNGKTSGHANMSAVTRGLLASISALLLRIRALCKYYRYVKVFHLTNLSIAQIFDICAE